MRAEIYNRYNENGYRAQKTYDRDCLKFYQILKELIGKDD